MLDIFVLSKDMNMKAIEYTNKLSTNIINLIYSTCTNDLIVHSKQASILESFLLAFCLEFNRLFIADSLLMMVLKEQVIVKTKEYCKSKKTSCNAVLIANRNAISDYFRVNNLVDRFNRAREFEIFSGKIN